MDHAVALVQTYLQLNGYFTTAEYPIIEALGRGGFRAVTDVDILAFRFPTLSPRLAPTGAPHEFHTTEPDPGLAIPHDRIDMVIGEVKEGRVSINTGATDPAVLRSVLTRFGCEGKDIDGMVEGLLHRGEITMPSGYGVRLIAFGAMPPGTEMPPCRIISLGHVLQFLQEYVRKNWHMLRQCQFKDPAFGFLMTLEKARRGGAGRRGKQGVEVVTREPREGAAPEGRPAVAARPRTLRGGRSRGGRVKVPPREEST